MAEYELDAATREILARVSTATLSTALFKRGLRRQVLQDVRPVGAIGGRNMVGPAFTLRTIPAREDLDGVETLRDAENPQRKAIETCPPGAVLAIDSRRDARAASAGDILVARLKARGCAGIVTDGGFRDSAEIAALGFPAYHAQPSAPISLAHHHAVAIGEPIACGDAPIYPGDVLVGDAEAVIALPSRLVDDVAAEAAEMTAYEDFVAERVRDGASIVGLYPATDPANLAAFAAWRAERDR